MRGYPERVMNESGPGAPAVGAAATVAAAVPSRSRQLSVLLGTAAGVFVLDHLSKWLVTQHLALGSQVPASGPITIHHIENRGAAFGLFPQLQVVFLVVAAAVALYILFAGRRFGPGVFPQVLLGMVLGGAISNALDRFLQGYVVDFIDLQRWPVFNVADMAIVLGIFLGVLTMRTTTAGPAHDGAA
jgi:signal peptidase II